MLLKQGMPHAANRVHLISVACPDWVAIWTIIAEILEREGEWSPFARAGCPENLVRLTGETPARIQGQCAGLRWVGCSPSHSAHSLKSSTRGQIICFSQLEPLTSQTNSEF